MIYMILILYAEQYQQKQSRRH